MHDKNLHQGSGWNERGVTESISSVLFLEGTMLGSKARPRIYLEDMEFKHLPMCSAFSFNLVTSLFRDPCE